jgi:glucosylceramidase
MKALRFGGGSAVAALAVAAVIGGCTGTPTAPPSTGPQAWLTTGDKTHLLAPMPALATWSQAESPLTLQVDASRRFQRIVGFGASITDASAWLIRHRLNDAQRDALMRELFGRGAGGIGFSFTRLTIGASDFSTSHYTYNDLPPGQIDLPLANFSIAPARADVIPVVRQALAINPQLQVMASPWSAPAWMKTNGQLAKGSLRPDRYDVFARYLLRYVDAMAAEGVPIFALTMQNEPHFEPDGYPGMRLAAAQRAEILGRHLGPLLQARSPRVQLMDWDHNWDEPQSPLGVLADPLARRYVDGVAWHCYGGEVATQSVVRDAHPDKDAWFTECSGGEWKPHWPETLPWMARHVVIGSVRHWARGVLMWNLALDESHGPRLGGCPDCRGVVTIDSRTGAITRNLEYYALAHASRFVRPGAERIASDASAEGLDHVAFRNADDGSLVLMASNAAATPQRIAVRQGDRRFVAELPRESVATFVWQP